MEVVIPLIMADLIDRGKIAIRMGSTAAAVLGSLLILVFSKKRK